ncbi:TauD/TfdA family dioxygenase [Variovorax dokdonensis]|uniref:TauD/TfdA family dioxygenase n=1 Tax=Variovorax dokdonensis TaxID=344883 RepID=A0ABT7N5X7_9BURK|nr:TauD/TfdA family dioxygenase [Variovorax dokdonensis]MDM0043327.1 TauD/TfdA family dioxygenase [Variovorax dokdonensis]
MANTTPMTLIDIDSRYKHIRPVPRMPNFAAWIEGVDLTKPLSEPVKAELRQALFDFEVIFFKPQTITPQQHVALGQVFGPLSTGSYFDRNAEVPEMEMIVSDRERPPAIDNWHTDISWKLNPPLGTAIQITVTPPAGGNTCWSSTSKAYDWLSPGMQQYLEGLQAMHTWEHSGFREYLGQKGEEALIAAIKAAKPVLHPVVRVNPDSGRKCIFVNADFTRAIVGIDRHEARGVLQFLLGWLQRPEFMVHHQWEPGGIAIWDNRSTQHYAVADYWPHHRVNQRVTFNTQTPAAQHS